MTCVHADFEACCLDKYTDSAHIYNQPNNVSQARSQGGSLGAEEPPLK